MNKFIFLLLLMSSTGAYADMSRVAYSANIKNVCGHPIQVSVNEKFGVIEVNKVLNDNEVVDVLAYFICSGTRSIFTIGAFVSAI